MNIYILNTLDTGLDTVNILKKELDIKGMIGLSERNPGDTISGYRYMNSYCKDSGFDFVEVQSYVLAKPQDKSLLLSLDIDILIVCGWQRLIPAWLIEHCNICVIGAHGSMHGITKGRGRSPQNWALILGAKEFYISIFKIDPGIDSGDIIDTRKYELTVFDDIRTSYYKVCFLVARMIIENINSGKIKAGKFSRQEGESTYLPQRLPEDGQLDWNRTASEIYNFVRALTAPYPGAFTFKDGIKLSIIKGRPFCCDDILSSQPGEIVKIFSDGNFLVRTADAFLLVEEYILEDNNVILAENDVLFSCNYKKQMQTIISRHQEKYPDLPLCSDILQQVDL